MNCNVIDTTRMMAMLDTPVLMRLSIDASTKPATLPAPPPPVMKLRSEGMIGSFLAVILHLFAMAITYDRPRNTPEETQNLLMIVTSAR